MATIAEKFVFTFNEKTEGATRSAMDDMEPWTWADGVGNRLIADDGENFEVEFNDGSRIKWVNTDRSWSLS